MAPGEIGEIYPLSNPALDTEASRALPEIFHRHKSDIRAALRKGLAESPLQLYQMLRYSMGWSDVSGNPTTATEGKALRPTLCLLACEATGTPAEMAMPAAVSLEFIHDFSLIHDEIQDLDDTALVMGQAIENIAREDLTYIERAKLAARMVDEAGLQPADIDMAFSCGKTDRSRYLKIGRGILTDILQWIGKAPSAGRPRWEQLVTTLESDDAAEVRDRDVLAAANDEDHPATSDDRFNRV